MKVYEIKSGNNTTYNVVVRNSKSGNKLISVFRKNKAPLASVLRSFSSFKQAINNFNDKALVSGLLILESKI